MTETGHTLTADLDDGTGAGVARRTGALFLVLEHTRPTAGGARWCLDDIDTVTMGRGRERAWRRADRVLDVRLPDRHMSGSHARLERALGRWVLIDDGSKNGIVLNGERVDRASLHDGDVFEVGRCVFAYRSSVPPAGDVETLSADVPLGFHTALPALEECLARTGDVARSDVPVLIGGESGTGKELVARAIHQLSGRAGSLVPVNCGALSPNLVESELFGHLRGAFSGAATDRLGYVRTADRGTLLLDEIGDLPLVSQTALLRFLQEMEVTPVGSAAPISVDVRVVSATHRDVPAMVERGEFRADLLARLSGFRVALPPLRERREDLGTLLAMLLRRVAGGRAESMSLSRDAARMLVAYDWPLNVRELEQALAAACALARTGVIESRHLPDEVRAGPKLPTRDVRRLDLSDDDLARREQLAQLLEVHRGNISAVARAMGKARVQIHRWLKRYRLDPDQFR